MKNLVLASIVAVASAIVEIPAQAAIPVAPVQAPAAETSAINVDYYRGPYRSYYRGPYRTYYRGPHGAYYGRNYGGPNCYFKNVRHYRNGRVYVDRVRVCR